MREFLRARHLDHLLDFQELFLINCYPINTTASSFLTHELLHLELQHLHHVFFLGELRLKPLDFILADLELPVDALDLLGFRCAQ